MCVFLLMLRFMLRLKEPESYLQLSPLNQTLVSLFFQYHFYLMFGLFTFTVFMVRLVSAPKDEDSKPKEQKVSVKILLHYSGDLAAKFPYNQVSYQKSQVCFVGKCLGSSVFDTSFAIYIYPGGGGCCA